MLIWSGWNPMMIMLVLLITRRTIKSLSSAFYTPFHCRTCDLCSIGPISRLSWFPREIDAGFLSCDCSHVHFHSRFCSIYLFRGGGFLFGLFYCFMDNFGKHLNFWKFSIHTAHSSIWNELVYSKSSVLSDRKICNNKVELAN